MQARKGWRASSCPEFATTKKVVRDGPLHQPLGGFILLAYERLESATYSAADLWLAVSERVRSV